MGSLGHTDERYRSEDLQPVEFSSEVAPSSFLIRCYRSDFIEIMEMLDKRLNDKGKNWRHVFKVLLSGT